MIPGEIKHKIRRLPEFYSPVACLYHYLHMARGNFREYLKGETVWIKKYFYMLRPVLACKLNEIFRSALKEVWGIN